jgi:aminoglycoside phosphotransferase (APT) family kinase protein
MPVDAAVEGIDVPAVTRWFVANVSGVTPPLRFELIAGGRSNLTYRVEDEAGQCWALRRPPLSHVLSTAHDMAREHRVISAVGPTGFPVPKTLGLCVDPDVNGHPFYVMEFVDGHILRDAAGAMAALDQAGRRRAGESIADTLARLHAVDVDAVGLSDFAKHEDYIPRQLRRWSRQFEDSAFEGTAADDGADGGIAGVTGSGAAIVRAVHDRLAADVPEQRGVAIVHGDYRLDNTVLADDGTVRAVLDWELCTLGDPLADMGLLMVYWTEPGNEPSIVGVAPTTAPGFLTRAEVQDRYRAASGRDLDRLSFYVAFGYWKLACILQGVFARYAGGAAAGDRSSVDGLGASVVHLAEQAMAELEQA